MHSSPIFPVMILEKDNAFMNKLSDQLKIHKYLYMKSTVY